jgi:aryl-alcohol dehydrogenase-like predicted oxidoreductase
MRFSMKLILVEAIGEQVSAVGFGCASLGSRIGPREGLVALERAYDANITWYDVAPSYGDAMAEPILAEFISKKRDSVHICTKVGIRPATTPGLMRKLKPMSRVAVAAFPKLRRIISLARPKAAKVPLSPELIASSLEQSLRRLRTEYVDVLALHGPTGEEIVRDDILLALERVVRDGKARTIAIAGSLEVGLAGVHKSTSYGIVQIYNNPFQPDLAIAQSQVGASTTFVTHSAFSELHRLVAILDRRRDLLKMLFELNYQGSNLDIATAFLADYALASNSNGITLLSMFKREHLSFNLVRAEQRPSINQLNLVLAALLK